MEKLAFLLVMLSGTVMSTWAGGVKDINYVEWTFVGDAITTCQTKTAFGCQPLPAPANDWVTLVNGWYYVEGSVSIQTLHVYDSDVHLILCDNCELRCTGGVKLEEGHKLTIYSQSESNNYVTEPATDGRLVVTNSYQNTAGIGSAKGTEMGSLVIHGGNIYVRGGQYGAGIGTGKADGSGPTVGSLDVYGGYINAIGGDSGAGIGGGPGAGSYRGRDGIIFTQYGGRVYARGGEYAAGVGGGGGWTLFGSNSDANGGGVGTVTVHGGSLHAVGGLQAAGIGSGSIGDFGSYPSLNDYDNDIVTIDGGYVRAEGGQEAAGIGGGQFVGGVHELNISGNATVEAIGGISGAGIGGGNASSGRVVNISGGTVTAKGGGMAAGIGGGYKGNDKADCYGGTVTITAGTVTAIVGDKCDATDRKGGCAIGRGASKSQHHIDLEGEVVPDKTKNTFITLADNRMVRYGDTNTASSSLTTVEAADRVKTCLWNNQVEISYCQHAEKSNYTISGDKHIAHCMNCNSAVEEDHVIESNGRCVCGKKGTYVAEPDVTFKVAIFLGTSDGVYPYSTIYVNTVMEGEPYVLPSLPQRLNGHQFMGWMVDNNSHAGETILLDDDETIKQPGESITISEFTYIYARYVLEPIEETWTWANDYSTATLRLTVGGYNTTEIITPTTYTDSDNEYHVASYYTYLGVFSHRHKYSFGSSVIIPIVSHQVNISRDDTDNYDVIEENSNKRVLQAKLSNASLYKDGNWNTLCLPFDVVLKDSPLEGAKVKTLESASFSNGTLTLNFSADQAEMKAGVPYLIKWENTSGVIDEAVFNNVIIKRATVPAVNDICSFYGFYAPVVLTAANNNVLYLGADNTLYWPGEAMTINSCRATFLLDDRLSVGKTAEARIVMNFNDDNEASGIYEPGAGTLLREAEDCAWYSLDGRKLAGEPTANGLYIHNGRKVAVNVHR
jgi:hypothetical protein